MSSIVKNTIQEKCLRFILGKARETQIEYISETGKSKQWLLPPARCPSALCRVFTYSLPETKWVLPTSA